MNIILERGRNFTSTYKGIILIALMLLCNWAGATMPSALAQTDSLLDVDQKEMTIPADVEDEDDPAEAEAHAKPAWWSAIPFALLLAMIASGPLFYARFWHKYYPIIAIGLGVLVVGYYLLVLGDVGHPIHSASEYFSFISLLAALFIISGTIHIDVDKAGTPLANVVILIIGAVIANLVGTTGASMLLVRPFIRLNEGRIKPYHLVFFIFIVSNVGGCLTPIGDPPLFLGFLIGVPFQYTIIHLWAKWLFGVAALSGIFYFIDSRNKERMAYATKPTGKIKVTGSRNALFLVVVIASVFIDPNVLPNLPSFLFIEYHGDKISYLREVIMLLAAAGAYFTANKEVLKTNEFNMEPIREVGFLFIGIFATMMPALQLIGLLAQNNADMVNVNTLYWGTGGLSGILDNAPTYLNFVAAAMGKMDLDIGTKADVRAFAHGIMDGDTPSCLYLTAISMAAVFFGAFTYIGNAPNFMVKSIAEQNGIDMPSFVGYIIKYSIPILFPVLFISWLLFFVIL